LQQPFFFLFAPASTLLLNGAESADSFVYAHQVLAEFLEPMELGDFVLRLAQRSGIGEGFSHAFASDSPGQTELRVVTGVVGFGAMAGRLTAATQYGCDRAGPQVAEAKELTKEFRSIRFQSSEGVRHGFLSERYYTFRKVQQKKKNGPSATCMSRTPDTLPARFRLMSQ
jgi:hypothetical protein